MTDVNIWSEVDSVEVGMFKFENVGDTLVGALISRKMQATKFGDSPLYKALTADGEVAFFASSLLDDKLTGQVGKIVRIKFEESKPSQKGNDIKIFDVKAIDDNGDNRAKVGLPLSGDADWI